MDLLKNEILHQFKHAPTEGQLKLIDKLINFINKSITEKSFVLKGYAGTGKTTIISALVNALKKTNKKVVLLAPTGRAAKVLSNYSNNRAFTIHKKIYKLHTDKEGFTEIKLLKNSHTNTIFIIDEASMISTSKSSNDNIFGSRNLLNDLYEYVYSAENCFCILVGDTAQLPPVGLDISPSLDLEFLKKQFSCEFWEFELLEVVRQSQESGILSNATNLREKIKINKADFPFFNLFEDSILRKDITRLDFIDIEDELNTVYSKFGIDNTVIICRSNKLANQFNNEIRKRILFREKEIEVGDIMMVLKNNYFWLPSDSDIGFIANGDIVEIIKIIKIYDLYGFRFADAIIKLIDYPDQNDIEVKIILNAINIESASLPFSDEKKLFTEIMKDYDNIKSKRNKYLEVKKNPYLNALQVKFAYAMTCHKTQGGQWAAVFINGGYLSNEMINKEYLRWLYTALTRSTQKVFLINFSDKFFF